MVPVTGTVYGGDWRGDQPSTRRIDRERASGYDDPELGPYSLPQRQPGDARPLTHSAQVRIHGKVQGVWFRAWTVVEATALGLRGWVRNRSDGSVEALFVGDPEAVQAMVGRCRIGPPAARVERIEECFGTEPAPDSFVQRPTC